MGCGSACVRNGSLVFVYVFAFVFALLGGCATGSSPSSSFNSGVPGGPNPGATCGRDGLACCTSGQPCTDGTMCQSGRCRANTDCGGEGRSCCGTNDCDPDQNLICDAARRCVRRADCGLRDGACCTTGTPCGSGLVCQSNRCAPTATAMCGGIDQPCCTTGTPCAAGGVCNANRCVRETTCGGPNAACCAGSTPCNAGLECTAGRCETRATPTCGGRNQACCTRDPQCANDLTCCGASGMARTCVDTRADDRNCGMCGTACATGQRCGDRMCRGVPGTGTDTTQPGPAPGALCGGPNQVCCAGTQQCRETSLVCTANRCVTRGSVGGPQCITRDNACSPSPTGPQCCAGLTCDATTRQCRSSSSPGGGCTNDVDCANGQRCTTGGRCQCRASAETCTSDASCCSGLACVSNVCRTRTSAPTPPTSRPDAGPPPSPRPDAGRLDARPNAPQPPRDAGVDAPPIPNDTAPPPVASCPSVPPQNRCDADNPNVLLVCDTTTSPATVERRQCLGPTLTCGWDAPNNKYGCIARPAAPTAAEERCRGVNEDGGRCLGTIGDTRRYYTCDRSGRATERTCGNAELCQENSGFAYCSTILRDPRCNTAARGEGGCVGPNARYECDAYGQATEHPCGSQVCIESGGYGRCRPLETESFDRECAGQGNGWGRCTSDTAGFNCAGGIAAPLTCTGMTRCAIVDGGAACRMPSSITPDPQCDGVPPDYFWCVGNVRTSCTAQGLSSTTTCAQGCIDDNDGQARCSGGSINESSFDGRCGPGDSWSECIDGATGVRRCNAGTLSAQSCAMGCVATGLGTADCSTDFRCYNSRFYGAAYCYRDVLVTCDDGDRVLDERTCPNGCGGSFDGFDTCTEPNETGSCGDLANGETRCSDDVLVKCIDGALNVLEWCGVDQCLWWETPPRCAPRGDDDCEPTFRHGEHRCRDAWSSEQCSFTTISAPIDCTRGCDFATGECAPVAQWDCDDDRGPFDNGSYRCNGNDEEHCDWGRVDPRPCANGCDATTGRCFAVDCDNGMTNGQARCEDSDDTSVQCAWGVITRDPCTNTGGCNAATGYCEACRYEGADFSVPGCSGDRVVSCDGTTIRFEDCAAMGLACIGGSCL